MNAGGGGGQPLAAVLRVRSLIYVRYVGWLVGWENCIWDRRGRVFAMLNFSLRFIGKVAACNVKFEIFFGKKFVKLFCVFTFAFN